MGLVKISGNRNPVIPPRKPRIEFSPGVMRPTSADLGVIALKDIGTELEVKRQEKLLPENPQKTELDVINDLNNAISGSDDLLGMFNKAGGFSQMGVMDIRSRNIPLISNLARQRIGKSGDEIRRFNQFFSKNEEIFQKLRKTITGAQASFQELKALRPIVPNVSDDPNIYLAKLMAFRNSAQRERDRRLVTLQSGGRETEGIEQGIQGFENSTKQAKVEFLKALTKIGIDEDKAIDLIEDTFKGFRPEDSVSLSTRQTLPKPIRQE